MNETKDKRKHHYCAVWRFGWFDTDVHAANATNSILRRMKMEVVTVKKLCDMCKGTGEELYYIDGNLDPADCLDCEGSGHVWVSEVKENEQEPERGTERE